MGVDFSVFTGCEQKSRDTGAAGSPPETPRGELAWERAKARTQSRGMEAEKPGPVSLYARLDQASLKPKYPCAFQFMAQSIKFG